MIDHSVFPDAGEDRTGFLVARNVAVTDARLERIAAGYADATTDEPQVAEWLEAWLADPHSAPWLYLCGPVGVGKTHAAIAAVREAVQVPRAVVWELVTFSALLESRRPGADQVEASKYERADLLVIDDLGMVKASSEWAIEELWRLIDYRRRNQLCTIVTANLAPGKLTSDFNEAIVSRIAQDCILVAMRGTDRRYTGRHAAPAPVAAEPDPTVRDRSPEVDEMLGKLRTDIPAGKPDQLRHGAREWNRLRRQAQRTDDEPNPAYLDRLRGGAA
jgi:hypothetical protein